MNKPLAIEDVMKCAEPLNLVPQGGVIGLLPAKSDAIRCARMSRIYDEMAVAKEALGYYRRASVDSSLSTARRREHRQQVKELDAKCVELDRQMNEAVLL